MELLNPVTCCHLPTFSIVNFILRQAVSSDGGALLLRVPDNEAQATLDSIRDNDPFTRFGLAQYELWPWATTIGTEDLDRL